MDNIDIETRRQKSQFKKYNCTVIITSVHSLQNFEISLETNCCCLGLVVCCSVLQGTCSGSRSRRVRDSEWRVSIRAADMALVGEKKKRPMGAQRADPSFISCSCDALISIRCGPTKPTSVKQGRAPEMINQRPKKKMRIDR